MATHKNLKSLFNALGSDIGRSLNVIREKDDFKKVVVAGIDKGLGEPNVTSPHAYKRRGENGGLTDPSLIISTKVQPIKRTGGYDFVTNVQSIAKGNGDYRGGWNPAPDLDNFYVADIVATGIGYSWVNSKYYNPSQQKGLGRPIYQEAAKKLAENDTLADMVATELARRGWK